MKEIFKDIPTYEGIYQVSNLGKVKSLERVIIRSDGKPYSAKEKILKNFLTDRGYYSVKLYKNKILKTITVHQLVSMAFLNHTPCGYKLVVNHIDFDKKNNNVSNLELVTQRENANHKHLKSSSKYTGVCWNKARNKWQSNIKINGKLKHLGLFTNEYDAHLAYENALKQLT